MKVENETGFLLRDAGAELALVNAGEEWHDMATTLTLKHFAEVGWDGALFEDARVYAMGCGIGIPPSPNAWGAVALSLSKRNLISKTGVLLPSKRISSHARSQPVWRLASLHAQSKAGAIKPWVGLTDEEVKHMLELFVIPPQHIEMVVQAIEAKLKEKNT